MKVYDIDTTIEFFKKYEWEIELVEKSRSKMDIKGTNESAIACAFIFEGFLISYLLLVSRYTDDRGATVYSYKKCESNVIDFIDIRTNEMFRLYADDIEAIWKEDTSVMATILFCAFNGGL